MCYLIDYNNVSLDFATGFLLTFALLAVLISLTGNTIIMSLNLLIINNWFEVIKLGGIYYHWKIALENRDGAKSEFRAVDILT